MSATASEGAEIELLEIRRPLVVAPDNEPLVEFALSAEDGAFQLRAGDVTGTTPPPAFVVGRALPLPSGTAESAVSPSEIQRRMTDRIAGAELYRRFAAHGLNYGPAFQGVAEAWAGKDEALGRIVAPATVEAELGEYRLHPAVLDACLQVALAALPDPAEADPGSRVAFLPSKVKRVRFFGHGGRIGWCHVTVAQVGPRSVVGDFLVLDVSGSPVARIEGLRLRRVDLGSGEIPAYHWRQQPRPLASRLNSADDLLGPHALARAAVAGQQRDTGVRQQIDRIAAAYVRQAVTDLAGGNPRFDVRRLVADGGVAADRGRYLEQLLVLLERAGLAEREGAEWSFANVTPIAAPEKHWRQALAEYPAHLASLEAIARWGEALPGILRAEIDPAAIVSSGRGFDVIEQLRDLDPLFRSVNDAAASALRRVCVAIAGERPLRIIEINGGAAGLTASLLPVLPIDRAEYVFTDPSETAVARAEARFASFSSFSSSVLDPAKDLAAQGVESFTYDLVVATAPHRNLAAIRSLLKPGGLLFAVVPKAGGFLDLALGQFAEQANPAQIDWPSTLAAEGFEEITSLAEQDPLAVSSIVVARNSTATQRVDTPYEPNSSTWVILTDDGLIEPAATVMTTLAQHGRRTVLVQDGGSFERLGLDRFNVPAGDREAYTRLFRILAADGVSALQLLHLRGVAEPEPIDPVAARTTRQPRPSDPRAGAGRGRSFRIGAPDGCELRRDAFTQSRGQSEATLAGSAIGACSHHSERTRRYRLPSDRLGPRGDGNGGGHGARRRESYDPTARAKSCSAAACAMPRVSYGACRGAREKTPANRASGSVSRVARNGMARCCERLPSLDPVLTKSPYASVPPALIFGMCFNA